MKKIIYTLVLAASLLFILNPLYPQFVKRTPYPIIFVHGIIGDNTTWDDPEYYDIIEFLADPTVSTPLTYGGVINITLDYDRSTSSLENTVYEDVHLFTSSPIPGDLYVINFDVHATGIIPHEIPGWGFISENLLTDLFVSFDETELGVTIPANFFVGDIIRITDEFMQVNEIHETSISVTRHILNSQPQTHIIGNTVWNLSTESNQAAIVKQGYGLKKAIDKIKLVTEASKVILVCHSMGGLAAREYIRSYYNNDVAKIVTIGTPHYGSNLTDLPDFVPFFIPGIDPKSDAVRDLRTGFDNSLGVYLFGGSENSIWDYFYSKDVNCNKSENDFIEGLNDNYQNLGDMGRTWIASNWIGNTYLVGPNDGIVLTSSQFIYSGDTLMTHTPHISTFGTPSESKDIYALIRGMDEPDEPEFAYEIDEESTTKGFITLGRNYNPEDRDLFKLIIPIKSEVSISLLASSNTGIQILELLDDELALKNSTNNIYNVPMVTILEAGSYFIKIKGSATANSYEYPYTLTTSTTEIQPNSLVTSPEDLLEYYDVVVNEYRDKIVTLTNNGSTVVTVSSIDITGLNANQFAITSPISFDIPPTGVLDVTVRFNPTLSGEKNATLVITNNSSDAPVINISLHGTGVDFVTMTLLVNPDISYNYGNVTIISTKNKTFQLQNTGSNPLTVSGLSLSGTHPGEYSIITQPEVPFDLETGELSQVTIKFAPTSIGVKSADFVITNNSDNASPEHAVTLYGNGLNNPYTGVFNSITAYEYWFDDDYNGKIVTPVNQVNTYNLNLNVPTPNLAIGLHSIHFRFQDEEGYWSSVISQFFYKQPLMPPGGVNLVEYEYWFDNEYGTKINETIEPTEIHQLITGISSDNLTQGLHSFHLRYKDNLGKWSSVISQFFYKQTVLQAGGGQITGYEYWFDDEYSTKVSQSVEPTEIHHLITGLGSDNLPQGLHSFHIRYKDNAGRWSSVVSQFFYKTRVTNGLPNLVTAYRYWFDLSDANMVTTNLPVPVNPLNLVTEINTCSLNQGDHTVHLQFNDTYNYWSSVVTDTFNIPALTNPLISAEGPTIFCEGGSVMLTSTLANSYQWSNGATTQRINVSISGNYFVTIDAGCGNNLTSNTITITVNPKPAAAGIVSGPSTFYQGQQDVPYSVEMIANATDYIWSYSGTGVIINGTGANITIDFTALATSGQLSVKGHNACGDGSSSTLDLLLVRPLNLTIFLEGPYNGDDMNTSLYAGGLIPLNQPYNSPPWNYPGTESVTVISNSNVVDWVLVELRETTGEASTATSDKVIARKAAFILKDGNIVGLDGITNIQFEQTISSNLYVVILHRNHISVMSSDPLPLTDGQYSWDFTTSSGKVYGGTNGYKELPFGSWGMAAGDADANGLVDAQDKNSGWKIQAGQSGYKTGDVNLNGQVENKDKDDLLLPNIGKGSQVPE